MQKNKNNIPIHAEDRYWGKVSESRLKEIIELIETNGFSIFDKDMQKELDFTYDEDRADWRFYMPIDKNSDILDIGAGLGRISIPLARVARKVTSCDLSLSRMRFLKLRAESEKLSNIEVMVGDVFNLPFKEESFDLIIMNGVLEWVGLEKKFQNPRDAQIECLKICKRLLKKGGHLYIGIENRVALVYLMAKDHGGLRYTSYMPRFIANLYSKIIKSEQYRTYTYTKRGYQKLLKEADFAISPDFYLVYPGYNLPRIIIPYNNIKALIFLVKSLNKPRNFIKKTLNILINLPFLARIYRFFFFSFGIIVKK